MQIPKPPRWVAKARCGGLNPELFFPQRGEDTAAAKSLCETCPVRWECLAFGWREKWGIWGGYSDRERRALRREYASATEVEDAVRKGTAATTAREAHLRAKCRWVPSYLRQTESVQAEVALRAALGLQEATAS